MIDLPLFALAAALSVFIGGAAGCGRPKGGAWVMLYALCGVLIAPIRVGMAEHAVPPVVGSGYIALWLAALGIALWRMVTKPVNGITRGDRVRTGSYALAGSIILIGITFVALDRSYGDYPDFAMGATFLAYGALIMVPLGGLLGWLWAGRRARSKSV